MTDRMRAVGQVAFPALDGSEMLGAERTAHPGPQKEMRSSRNPASPHCCFPYPPRGLGVLLKVMGWRLESRMVGAGGVQGTHPGTTCP